MLAIVLLLKVFFTCDHGGQTNVGKALVMVELLDSEEEETKGLGMTRSWLKKKEELDCFTNIVRELQLEDTEGFKEMMRMDLKQFNKILNLVALDITPQEIIGGKK